MIVLLQLFGPDTEAVRHATTPAATHTASRGGPAARPHARRGRASDTSPRRRQRWGGANAGTRMGLPGTRPERERHGLPQGQPGEGAGEVQDDPAGRDLHAGPEFEEPLAERPNLEARRWGRGQPLPQPLEQDVGRGGEEHPEGVRPEARAARPVEAEAGMQLLQPVLHVAPLAVDLVYAPGRLGE